MSADCVLPATLVGLLTQCYLALSHNNGQWHLSDSRYSCEGCEGPVASAATLDDLARAAWAAGYTLE